METSRQSPSGLSTRPLLVPQLTSPLLFYFLLLLARVGPCPWSSAAAGTWLLALAADLTEPQNGGRIGVGGSCRAMPAVAAQPATVAAECTAGAESADVPEASPATASTNAEDAEPMAGVEQVELMPYASTTATRSSEAAASKVCDCWHL